MRLNLKFITTLQTSDKGFHISCIVIVLLHCLVTIFHYNYPIIGIYNYLPAYFVDGFFVLGTFHFFYPNYIHRLLARLPSLTNAMAQFVGQRGGLPPFAEANLKIPPAWDPRQAHVYPFSVWTQDIQLWAAATDMDEDRLAPAVVMRLAGTARDLARELDINTLQNGMQIDVGDGNGPQPMSGLAVLLRGLSRKFGPLGIERNIKAIAEFMAFSRLGNEDIDSVLSRFDLLKTRAEAQGFQINWTGASWMFLRGLHIPATAWPNLLLQTQGNLPADELQFRALEQQLRRSGHMHEAGPYNLQSAGQRQGGTGAYLWPPADAPSFEPDSAFIAWNQDPHEQTDYGYSSAAVYHSDDAGTWWDDFQCEVYWSDAPDAWQDSTACVHCGCYYADSDTESSVGSEIPDAELFQSYIEQNLDQNAAGEAIYFDYLFAKKRWRRFSGRKPRHQRFGSQRDRFQAKGKGKGKGKFAYNATTFSPSFLPTASQVEKARAKEKAKVRVREAARATEHSSAHLPDAIH